MTVEELANDLGVNYHHAYNMISKCKHCGNSVLKGGKNPCTCGKREPFIHAFDIGRKTTSEWRIEEKEVERYKKERML